MVAELKELGVEVMISPYFHSVAEQSKYYKAAAQKGFLVLGPDGKPANVAFGDAFLYDLYQPEARAFAFSAVQQGYITPFDLHHWWLDCDEPCGVRQGGTHMLQSRSG